MTDGTSVKPDYEMFYGIPYKAFCGKCGKIIFTGGRYNTISMAEEKVIECPHCGCRIDWARDT